MPLGIFFYLDCENQFASSNIRAPLVIARIPQSVNDHRNFSSNAPIKIFQHLLKVDDINVQIMQPELR